MKRGWATAATAMLVLAAILASCGSGSRGAPVAPAPAIANVAEPAAGGDDDAGPPAADPACVAGCLGRYPEHPDPDGDFAAYCARMCEPTDEVNASCAHHCEQGHLPPSSYEDYYGDGDDGGPPEPEVPSDEELAAIAEGCAETCRAIPDVSDVLDGCVAACIDDGDPDTDDRSGESYCQIECDPDPHDTCVYQPCD